MASLTPVVHKPSCLARLRLDLSELLASPYPGVSVHLDESNMYKLCLHLCPNSGPYQGLRLHFEVDLPTNVRLSFHRCFQFVPLTLSRCSGRPNPQRSKAVHVSTTPT